MLEITEISIVESWSCLILLNLERGNDNKTVSIIDDKITDFNLDELDVKVQKEIINGDTVMNVTVNGEEINSSSFLEDANKISWTDKNGDKKVVMIKSDFISIGAPMKKEKKIIRKRVEKSSK